MAAMNELNWSMPTPNRLKAQEVVTKLRFKLADTTINKYSDTELLIALNEGIELLWQALEANYSSLTRKVAGYDLIDGHGQLLPEDYSSLVSITGDIPTLRGINPSIFDTRPGNAERFVRIEGEYIVGCGKVRLTYNYTPKDVTLIDEPVDVPQSLVADLVAITSNIVTQNMEGARERASAAGTRTSEFREFGAIPRKRAFP
jgi:hypothetical protein